MDSLFAPARKTGPPTIAVSLASVAVTVAYLTLALMPPHGAAAFRKDTHKERQYGDEPAKYRGIDVPV